MFSICSNTGSSSSCFRFPVAILSLKSNNNKRKTCKTNLFFLFMYMCMYGMCMNVDTVCHSIYAKVRGLLKVSSCLGKASLLLHCILQASGPRSFLFLPLLSTKSEDITDAPYWLHLAIPVGARNSNSDGQTLCSNWFYSASYPPAAPPTPAKTNSKEKLFTHSNIGLDSLQSFLCGSFW